MPIAARPLLAAIVVLGIAWIVGLPRTVGMAMVLEEFLGVILALTLAAAFILYRAPAPLPRQLDYLCAATAFACWGWMSWNYTDWLLTLGTRGPDKWLPGAIGLALLVEAVRRSCGNAITVLILVIAAYAFLAHLMPGFLQGGYVSPSRVILYLYSDTNGVPGIVLGVAAGIVLGFIIFGATLRASGGADAFTEMAMAAMGRYRGGAAKVSIAASSIFGTLSGSTVGNVMSTGVVTIPLMKRTGFPAHYAAAVEAVASNGGQLAPPVMGATAFLIAEFLQIGYVDVVLAAIVPAIIYYLVLFLQVDIYASRYGLAGLPSSELPRLGSALKRGSVFLVPLAVLIYLLFWLAWSPAKAALASAAICLCFVPFKFGRLPGARYWHDMVMDAGRLLVPLLLISAGAGIVIGALNLSGLGFSLTLKLSQVGELFGLVPLLTVCAIAAIILGMGMPTSAVYVVLSVLLAPALVDVGIPPIAAHLFIFYFGLLSMITPPVAIASYAAAGLAGSDLWRTGISGLQLAFAAYILPFVFCLNPALLMVGSVPEIIVAIVAMTSAGYLLGVAFAGRGKIASILYFICSIGLCVLLSLAPHALFSLCVASLAGFLIPQLFRRMAAPVQRTIS